MFNTLKYAKILQSVGFSQEQAETSIRILAEIMDEKLATKQDLKELESRMDSRFVQLEYKLTLRMGTMFAATIAILTAIQKLT